MNFEKCALCLKEMDLCKSHILPNGLFRRLKKGQSAGQLITFNTDTNSVVRRSQETWWEYLLCRECENIVRSYKSYGLNFFRGDSRSRYQKIADGVVFRAHDYAVLKLFLTSLIWRASASKQEVFSSVILLPNLREEARVSLFNRKALGPSRFGVRITRMVDNTGVQGAFTHEVLKNLIVSPMLRISKKGLVSFLFLLEGFLLEYFVPSAPFSLRNSRGMQRNISSLFAPFQCIFTVPELVEMLNSTIEKRERGLIHLKD